MSEHQADCPVRVWSRWFRPVTRTDGKDSIEGAARIVSRRKFCERPYSDMSPNVFAVAVAAPPNPVLFANPAARRRSLEQDIHWLPWARENCKPSTVAGYETMWNTYLAPYLQKISPRDFRTVDAAKMFAEIHRQKGIGRTTLQHCKSRLSGIFTLARNLGALDSPNPVNGAMIPKRAAAPADTHAATPDEVLTILEILRKDGEVKARAAVALMFFAGLRPGEARGARWEDFDGKRLTVCQSVWHKFTTEPKTENAASPVPVIETLADILAELRQADGNPSRGPMLRGPSGKPLLLDNVLSASWFRPCAVARSAPSGNPATKQSTISS